MYDGTKWREVPALTLMPQNSHIHECPVYGEVLNDPAGNPYIGWAMHGPQEPLEIGVESPVALPDKGKNAVTGAERLQFDAARPVPWVHSMVLEWFDYKRLTWFHWEGGVRIHQVAQKRIWYTKSSYGDDGTVSANPDKQFAINGKIIFVQRLILDVAGQPAVCASSTSWAAAGGTTQIAGGPSTFTLEHRGTKHYPKFNNVAGQEYSKLLVKINEAKFNPERFALLAPFINRQGMVVTVEAMHDYMHTLGLSDLTPEQCWAMSAWEWRMGDGLPHADVPATIQH